MQVAQGDVGDGVRCDDAAILERDDGQEQADAGGDRRAYRWRYAVDDHFPHAEQGDGDEQAAGDKHRTQRNLPRVVQVADHEVGEIGIQAHARRQCDGVIGVQGHDQGADGSGDAGGDEDRVARHAGVAQDGWVDEYDIGHRQERGQAGHDLGLDVGFMQL